MKLALAALAGLGAEIAGRLGEPAVSQLRSPLLLIEAQTSQDHRAIDVRLTTVTSGTSRVLTDSPPPRSAP